MMSEYLPCLYAMVAVAAFSLVLEEKNVGIIISGALSGFASWFVYLITVGLGDGTRGQTIRYLLATIVVAALSEIFARVHKAPATVFLIIGILPLVPGGSIYKSLEQLIDGNVDGFTYYGLKAVACAGAIAVGCSLVSSAVRVVENLKKSIKKNKR